MSHNTHNPSIQIARSINNIELDNELNFLVNSLLGYNAQNIFARFILSLVSFAFIFEMTTYHSIIRETRQTKTTHQNRAATDIFERGSDQNEKIKL